ncbi:MAG: hypothetical protein ACI841_004812 [Planctomycetota bacterium]|jgi:hypothetical protein
MNFLTSLSLPLSLCTLASGQMPFASTAGEPSADSLISFDQVAYDTPGDGLLWARGRTFKASFGPEGFTYIPFLGSDAERNMPVQFRLKGASLGGQAIELEPTASWSRQGETIVLDRGAVDVHYLMNSDSIEQTFVLNFAPHAGELEVRIQVQSELQLGTAGEGFRLRGERGGVDYGRATVLDAGGRSLALESRLEGHEICISVPESFLQAASWPVVVDPVITTYQLTPANMDAANGDICFDASSQHYYQVFSTNFSAEDSDIYGAVIGTNGEPRYNLGAWIDQTSDSWFLPSCASSNAADNSLVVAVAKKNDKYEIWGRVRNLPLTSQGGPFQISEPSDNRYWNPNVGGDPNADTFNRYFVAYSEDVSNSERHILGRAMQSSGVLVGPVTVIDATPDVINRMPHVSKSCGTGAVSERRFNVVWMREDGEDWDIRGAQMNSYGFSLTPSFSVDNTSEEFWSPQVSAPLDSPDGATRDFLVVYSAHGEDGAYIKGRLFKDDAYQASFNINDLEAQFLGQSMDDRSSSWPAIGTDGSQFVVAYAKKDGFGPTGVVACTLRHYGAELLATSANVVIAEGEDDYVLPNVATQHDAGLWDSRAAAIDYRYQELNANESVMGAIFETPDGWGVLGQTICEGQVNASGQAASFRVYGSSIPSDNQVVLDVNGLPPFSSGQFIMSTSTQNLAFGNGVLCIGQPMVRLNSTLGNSWVQGSVGYELDLTNLPGATVIQGGQSWSFQYWYRDGSSFNFSNAETVMFQ